MANSINELNNPGMRTKFGSGTNITTMSPNAIKAGVIKKVVKNLLYGIECDNIKTELESLLIQAGYRWETNHEKETELVRLAYFINLYVQYESQEYRANKEYFLPDDDTNVTINGKDYKAPADFYILDEQNKTITISRIKTGNADWGKEGPGETLALGLLGRKTLDDIDVARAQNGGLPHKDEYRILVEYDYLQANEATLQTETNRHITYENSSRHHVHDFNYVLERKLTQDLEALSRKGCEGGCAGCPMTNICNYVEPPITLKVAKGSRGNLTDIHLTGDQKLVEEFTQGNARVNAGPGSGKTLVTAMHVVYLLTHGYNPEDIGIFTFTRTGAEEFTTRILELCAAKGVLIDPERLTSTTFNSFCQKILDSHYTQLGYVGKPRVIPKSIKLNLVKGILDRFDKIPEWKYISVTAMKGKTGYMKNQASQTIALTACVDIFDKIKTNGWTREENSLVGFKDSSVELIFQMYEYYQEKLHERCLIDYDDQLLLVNKLYEADPALFQRDYPFKAIIVDEFQDTDPKQVELLLKMRDTQANQQFMAIGDDTQSIYGFRGASPEPMINFETYFGRFTDIHLHENHRSTKEIIDLANEIVPLDTTGLTKTLIPTKGEGRRPQVEGFYTQKQEYESVAAKIQHLINDEGVIPSDIAFIAHNSTELKNMADALTKLGIPSIMMNPIPFKENARVAALQSFFQSYISKGQTNQGLVDYKNVLMHGALKGYTGEEIESLANEFEQELRNNTMSISHFKEYAKALDVNETDECYQQFLEQNIDWCNSMDELKEFFYSFDLYGDNDCAHREGKYEGVSLITVHSAKGLEWDNVFLSLDNIYSREFTRTGHNTDNYFEAIRKWFVGVTRARKYLDIVGKYTCLSSQQNYSENEFLKSTYGFLGLTWGYNHEMETYLRNMEQQEALERRNAEARARLQASGLISNTIMSAYAQSVIDAQANVRQTPQTPAEPTLNVPGGVQTPYVRPVAIPPQNPQVQNPQTVPVTVAAPAPTPVVVQETPVSLNISPVYDSTLDRDEEDYSL